MADEYETFIEAVSELDFPSKFTNESTILDLSPLKGDSASLKRKRLIKRDEKSFCENVTAIVGEGFFKNYAFF